MIQYFKAIFYNENNKDINTICKHTKLSKKETKTLL